MRSLSSLLLSSVAALAICRSTAADLPDNATPGVYKRMMVMMFENQGYPETLANEYWDTIARGGLLVTGMSGVTHPSQCNYVAQLGGSMFGCVGDNDYTTNATSIVDLFDAAATPISWKSYQEDYKPLANGDCNTATNIESIYWRKHNPFMSYSLITSNLTRCQNIVNAEQFVTDAKAGNLPQFIYYTPNIDNDGHDTGLDDSGKFLTDFLKKNLQYLTDTFLYITFDEDAYMDNNHVIGVLYGPGITPGTQDDGTKYNQYSVGATIEANWNLGSLGRNDADANNFLHAPKTAVPRTDIPNYEVETPAIIQARKARCESLDAEFEYVNNFRVLANKQSKSVP